MNCNRKLTYKIIALTLIFSVMTAIFSSCGGTVVVSEGDAEKEDHSVLRETSDALNLGYSSGDSLNPFFIGTDLNLSLISLIYEPLFHLDDSFKAEPCVAEKSSVKDSVLTVKLNGESCFSDGGKVTSADVLYSFNAAKKSENYKSELLNISSCKASGSDTVNFSVKGDAKRAADSLNFPIVKNSTASNKDSFPIGTGLYSVKNDETGFSLIYNSYRKESEPSIKTINLIDVPESSTLIHTYEMGSIDAYFDDFSSGSYSRASAGVSKANLTNLVFLGFNQNSFALGSENVRKAVYYSINRQSIAKNSFKNYAVPAATPYHPEWHVLSESGYDISGLTLDYDGAEKLMKSEGYKGSVSYNLAVYAGNGFKTAAAGEIKENLKNIGINVNILELPWDEYMSAVQGGGCDLYIGEIKLPLDMNMSSLFGSSGEVYGANPDDAVGKAYNEFVNGNISLGAFTDSFLENMPFAPIAFRSGALIYSNKITPAADCDINNIYKNIFEWTIVE